MALISGFAFLWVFFVTLGVDCSKTQKKSELNRGVADTCKDFGAVSSKCHMWKDMGFCFKHRREMQFVCSRTCKFCEPGEYQTEFTSPSSQVDENAQTKGTVHLLDEPEEGNETPTAQVAGKPSSALSVDDVAGMLQSLTGKISDESQSRAKELAVIQGRIQKAVPTTAAPPPKVNPPPKAQKVVEPNITIGGKMQKLPPPLHDLEMHPGMKVTEITSVPPAEDAIKTLDEATSSSKADSKADNKANTTLKTPEDQKLENTLLSVMKILQEQKDKQKAKVNGTTDGSPAENKNKTKTDGVVQSIAKILQSALKTPGSGEANNIPADSTNATSGNGNMGKIEAGIQFLDSLISKGSGKTEDKGSSVSSADMLYNIKLLEQDIKGSSEKTPSDPKTVTVQVPGNPNLLSKNMTEVNVSTIKTKPGEFLLQLQDKLLKQDDTIPYAEVKKPSTANANGNGDDREIADILQGLSQDDKKKDKEEEKAKPKRKKSKKRLLTELRESYEDLGGKVEFVEKKEGKRRRKKKKEDGDVDEDEGGKKKRKRRRKHKNDSGDQFEELENDDEEDEEDEEDNFYNSNKPEQEDPPEKLEHLQDALESMQYAGEHLEMAEGKRKKMSTQASKREGAQTREPKKWENIAQKLSKRLKEALSAAAEKDRQHELEKWRLQNMVKILVQREIERKQRERDREDVRENDGDVGPPDSEEEDDRSRILHNMAAKLLHFTDKNKTFTALKHRPKNMLKRERVLHSLVSKYRGLVAEILANWAKVKKRGKKKNRIPRKGLSDKRGEIMSGSGSGSDTTKATIASPQPPPRPPRPRLIPVRKVHFKSKPRPIPARKIYMSKPRHIKKKPKEEPVKVDTDDEDVVEVVN
ncbi:daf-12-interacting protein 1 isoform X2 [Nematostella vectensis]|uniref:daf-12-interacting protein 1 isoform X2 n=1 Tax=Nematostella vectensis TaxID=45351 RepID=UPI00138FA127|nr:daf-12-interacting protein 1 isoform X2 [Nematostella vectensis]